MKRKKMSKVESVLLTIAIITLGLLNGCGSSRNAEKESAYVWPEPPDTARIKYVRTLRGEDDFTSGFGAVVKTLAGEKTVVQLSRPFDICVADEGRIFVTDVSQGIFMFDLKEKQVKVLGEESPVELKNPRGIAYGHGKVFVSLASVGQIAVLDKEGRFIKLIGKPESFPNTVDVVCDTNRSRILIVDNKYHQIYVCSENGDSIMTIGQRGVGDGEFNYPQSAAVDADGSIYVVDAMNFRIEVFDSTGKFLRKFGKQGDAFGMFNRPKGIAIDSYKNIYVLDAIHQNYQIFNNNGELLLYVGKYSGGNDGFENPISIAIDRNNTIYVTDQLNGRVQVFQLLEYK